MYAATRKTAIAEATKAYRSTVATSLMSTSIQTTTRSMSAFSHMSDNDPEVLQKEKEKNLSKKDRKEWNEKLASHSEAAVKADKEREKPIEHLQSETLEDLKKRESEDN
ncbi:uncharacterized protein B0P05DRAFT_569950 [Gilbertella persicaria]|uniref:uncharacterized protein n=1 Tax=Gilbertella persicaria TaxID=101096 RepID=UPI00221FC26C|nr:uncharacterized protein B0P05DRAFT_569950 [Gilbertella persicaria]KAI8087047.1 hypothetical protein B0P05DRAFT_569950 [Gilbertella persicaria]